MRSLTLTWYDVAIGNAPTFRQLLCGRRSLTQPDYRRIARMAGQAAVFSAEHTVDGLPSVTTVPATPAIVAYIAARGVGKRQRVNIINARADKAAVQAQILANVDNAPKSVKRRIFC